MNFNQTMNFGLFQIPSLNEDFIANLKEIKKTKKMLFDGQVPAARRGLNGILFADDFLKKSEGVGILIGGLAEKIWNPKRKVKDLESHKDVDILVLRNYLELEPFYGGIDWWTGKNKTHYLSDMDESRTSWFENSNGVILPYKIFSLINKSRINPGLYFLGKEALLQIRQAEINAMTDERIQINYDSMQEYLTRIRSKIKGEVPNYLSKEFGKRIVQRPYCPEYQEDLFKISPITRDEYTKLVFNQIPQVV